MSSGVGADADSEVPVVSKRVEEGLREKQLVRARHLCKPEIAEFVECTKEGMISVVWRCRGLKNKVNDCLAPYTAPEVLDQMKREYVAVKREERAHQ